MFKQKNTDHMIYLLSVCVFEPLWLHALYWISFHRRYIHVFYLISQLWDLCGISCYCHIRMVFDINNIPFYYSLIPSEQCRRRPLCAEQPVSIYKRCISTSWTKWDIVGPIDLWRANAGPIDRDIWRANARVRLLDDGTTSVINDMSSIQCWCCIFKTPAQRHSRAGKTTIRNWKIPVRHI